MAKIDIFGTLNNATGEPIVTASQVYDEERGKYLDELMGDSADNYMTAEEAEALVAEVFSESK